MGFGPEQHVEVAKSDRNKGPLTDIVQGVKIPRQQRLDLLDSLCCWQLMQDIAQPKIGLQAIGLGRFDQRVNDGASMGAGCRITKQPGPAIMLRSA